MDIDVFFLVCPWSFLRRYYPYKVIKNEEWFDSKEFQKVSPLGTQHINFLGKYIFEEKEINTEDGLRPLKVETH